ncbi:tyrosine-protein phosphatase [Devosia ginsengisoli]|uniref:Tyrosine-protein phosphatase n=1 Tax=Devosia ginsengisoli TaxID=400770 RepID=A0A5B8LX85_9HYPH|nr:tyrosine-protein phosphatase [Devosia ginsengisoli]QDZ12703.1 tyrosine-protein phosphatase [Devosia ginsengisoli]
MTMAAMRHWPLPDTHNIRDLGGYARITGGATQWRRILRGEALHPLRDDSIARLVEDGLTLVIDLRGPHETSLTSHPFREHATVAYRNIALFDALAPIAMSAVPFDMARRYCDALDKCRPQLAEVLRAVIAAPRGIVLFHCTAGKDRTGIIAALLLLISGVGRADIVADYALTAAADDLIGQLRERALSAGGRPEHVERVLASDAATMLVMLDHLDIAHGGIDAYLAGIGLTRSEVALLADRLCA